MKREEPLKRIPILCADGCERPCNIAYPNQHRCGQKIDCVPVCSRFNWSGGSINVYRTGFLVGIPVNGNPQGFYAVLVTARHIVDPMWACLSNQNPSALYARVNRKLYDPTKDSSRVDFINVPLVNGLEQIWHTDPSNTVDAAVIPIRFDLYAVDDVLTIPIAMLGTNEEFKSIGIGEDIVSAGLVPGLSGKKRNYPFLKFGKVSNVPDEQSEMPCGQQTKPASYWYIAATLIPGNSGSPIFLLPPGNAVMSFGNSRPLLLGLQSMSLGGGEIVGMVPGQYIFKIIEAMNFSSANLTRGLPSKPTSNSAQK